MVDAVVSYAVQNVGNLLNKEGNLLFGVRDQVVEMQNELKRMQCFLKDAERRKGESDSHRNLVSEIRDVAYDVEDVIEHFVLTSALRNQGGVKNLIHKYSINRARELHQMGSDIERIRAKLNNIRHSLQIYGIAREVGVGGAPVISRRKRQEHAHIVDHNVVGLDEKITELVLHLLDVEVASVVCVYGMGGLGKTTTAKQVYSDQRIRGHFEGFAWVYISQQFTKKQVWESILTQLSDKRKEEVEKMSNDDLASQLWKLQKEKKCLIVIDDIWQNQHWESLAEAAFPYMEKDSTRSKILVTSRKKDVVSRGVYRTSLDILDEITSFGLLKNTIQFLGGPNHPIKESSELDKCAEKMVKECGGLPLAIIVLGGILATKHELSEWERVGVNIRPYLSRGDPKMNGGVTRVLESSFEDLPYHLKPCFLYFSQYREDEEIKRSDLVQKWIGEGFVLPSMGVGDETMEEVAEDYLNELVSRCMVQVGTSGHTGRVNKCRMHDLVRDLCVSKAREEGFAQSIILKGEDNDGTNLENVNCRRLCVSLVGSRYNINKSNVSSLFPQLRSICLHTGNEAKHYGAQFRVVKLISKKMKLVRVLEVSHPDYWRWWKGKLRNHIHLRFLKLEVGMKATSLGLGDMRCLQTLNLTLLDIIPDTLWGMEQLRHLYLPKYARCGSSKQRVGNFRNLQTLVNFPPANFDLQQNLAKFNGVRKLVISKNFEGIGMIISSQEILFNRLQSLSFKSTFVFERIHLEAIPIASPRLYRLRCKGLIHSSATSSFITWPSNLTKLVLDRSKLDISHMGPLAKLQSLRVLLFRIRSFTGKEMIFHKNDFPKLCHLKLESLIELGTCIVREGALPSLVCLEIEDCKKLELVSEESQFLKRLKEIKVKYMPSTFVQRLERERGGDDKASRAPSVFFSNCDMDKPKSFFNVFSRRWT